MMSRMSQILKTETQKYALIGASFGLMFPVIATIIRMATSNLPFDMSNAIRVQATDPLLWIIDTAPLFLGIFAALAGRRQDAQQKLYEELRWQGEELEKSRNTLEQRVQERTFELEKRAAQFQTISRVARTIAAVHDLDSLLTEISRLVSEQFGFYHTGIFLNDESNEYAVLRAANSEGGQRMLDRHHQLKLDATSIVGYATSRGEPRIALDVGTDAVYFNNPDLPETRSEMALPLRIGGRTIGALDVQSTAQNAFLEEDINVLITLADQIAIAIENSRLFGESRNALSESQHTLDKYVKQVWGSFAQQSASTGFIFDGKQVLPLDQGTRHEQFKITVQTGRLTLEKSSSTIAIPIKLRGQTIGVLDVRSKSGQRDWTREEIIMLEAAAERAALALENSRLVEGAQRRAARERAIGEISAKIGAANNLDSILQIAVEELGRKISSSAEVTLELGDSTNHQDLQ